MKVVIVVLLVLLALTTAAMSAEDNWRIKIMADDGLGGSPSPGASMGVHPTSVDGLDFQDGSVYGGIGADTPGTAMHVVTTVPGQADVYGKCISAPTFPGFKTWDFHVAANVNSTASVIRLMAYTVSGTSLPVPVYGGGGVDYWVFMADNRGVADAPANGTRWRLPIPRTHSSTIPYWTCPINLPVIRLSNKSNDAMLAEGYRLMFVQTPAVPEPSSLLTLGAGLVGLAGLIRRRR